MKKNNRGYTLVEILIVIALFGVVSVAATQTMVAVLRAAKKTEAVTAVRQSLDYAVGSMERQLRTSKGIISVCNNTSSSQIVFTDQDGNSVTFFCVGTNPNGQPSYIASNSASLTSSALTISACSFTCSPATSTAPTTVTVSATGADANGQGASVTVTTQATLRTH